FAKFVFHQQLLPIYPDAALACTAVVDATSGTASLRGVAIAAGPLIVPLAVVASSERVRWWWVAIVGGLVAGPLRALFYDPFLDPSCDACRHSTAAIIYRPDLARTLLVVGAATTALALIAATFSRRHRWLLGGGATATLAALWKPDLRVAFGLAAAVVLSVDIARTTAARRQVRELVNMLRQNADLEHTLRRTLGDPALSVAYWLDDEKQFVAGSGSPTADRVGNQVSTELRVVGNLVGVIHHDPNTTEVVALVNALDGPARLALENERLAAHLAARERELQRSRARIIEHGDGERRALERDVHDGAQQHVLALGFDLRTAIAALQTADPMRPVLEECLAETMRTLDDLRELSHGLYPPSLDAGGLVPALRALSRRAPVEVNIGDVPSARLPPPVERTIFALVTDAAASANAEISVIVESREAAVEVHITGAFEPSSPVVADRVATLGGNLTKNGTTLLAVIPCG
ncbi:MAG: histidine kinase, partial [Ilumatobacteraceae bacterium]